MFQRFTLIVLRGSKPWHEVAYINNTIDRLSFGGGGGRQIKTGLRDHRGIGRRGEIERLIYSLRSTNGFLEHGFLGDDSSRF